MQERQVTICNKLGLHVRAATLFVQMANSFDVELTIAHQEQTADAKSIMEVLMLAATLGSEVVLTAEGDSPEEEAEALDSLVGLIENKFNEGE